MKRLYSSFIPVAAAALMCTSCSTHYRLAGIERSRILIDARYDANPDKEAAEYLRPYTARVDSIMSPVVGRTAHYMAVSRLESELSNLLSDILIWASAKFNETPDFAVYNVGGIRAALAEGKVTTGDIVDVAPFENRICFVSLTGAQVRELFGQIAARGGEGLSHSVRIVATSDRKLKSATINGKPIDDSRTYRIATLDYLAQGNDGMEAFKHKTDMVAPEGEANNIRNFICDYFREQQKEGKAVSSQVEGRMVIEK